MGIFIGVCLTLIWIVGIVVLAFKTMDEHDEGDRRATWLYGSACFLLTALLFTAIAYAASDDDTAPCAEYQYVVVNGVPYRTCTERYERVDR